MNRRGIVLAVPVFWALCGVPLSAAGLERVSIASDGSQANGQSRRACLSTDARYAAFESDATNLVPGDTNGATDIFVHDRETGTTHRVSVAADSTEPDGRCYLPVMSGDGRYVAFLSWAANLVPDDANDMADVFIRDLVAEETVRVSNGLSDTDLPPAISDDGRYGAFVEPGEGAVVVWDRTTGGTTPVSVLSDGTPTWGNSPSMSADGRYVAFVSDDAELAPPGMDTQYLPNVFVHDRDTAVVEWVSHSALGEAPDAKCRLPRISGDGSCVLFFSEATTLDEGVLSTFGDHLYLHDRVSGETALVDRGLDGLAPSDPCDCLHPDYDAGPSVSPDGRHIAFFSEAYNIVPGVTPSDRECAIYVRDRVAGKTSLISLLLDPVRKVLGFRPALSADGRFVAFESGSPDLVADDTNDAFDIFLRDRLIFEDVPLDHWAFHDVGACHMAGILQGYADGLYRPDVTVSRDQMAVYMARALAEGDVPTGPAEATFPDVPTDHWAYDSVEYAVAESIVRGYADGSYQPEWPVTRGQMAVFIARARDWIGLDDDMTVAPALFHDVPAGFWSGTAIEVCVDNGVVQGYSDGNYRPSWPVTRDQMAVYIARAFQLPV
jgi:Tol biopolymer transport system component